MCAICGDREAIVFMRRNDGTMRGDLALCEECARGRGLAVGHGRIELRLEDLVTEATIAPEPHPLICPNCGTDLNSIRRHGRLGCLSCITTFRSDIEHFFRARSKPPFFRDEYEAASLRREKLKIPIEPTFSAGANADELGPISLPAFNSSFTGKPDDLINSINADVVLETRARVSRNFEDTVFPGSPRGSSGFVESLSRFASDLSGMAVYDLGRFPEEMSSFLIEDGVFPRSYSLGSTKRLLCSYITPLWGVFGETDHLRLTARAPGLDPERVLLLAQSGLKVFEPFAKFAFDEEFGFISSRLMDCGSGAVLVSFVHLPALSQEGLLERTLRSLMARGLSVRGYYGSDDGSVGDVYEVSTEKAFGQSLPAMVSEFNATLGALVQAEKRAREDFVQRHSEDILDRAGRALGLIRYCRFISESEAAASLSALRLASLVGFLEGADASLLGRLMRQLGPGGLALRYRLSGPSHESQGATPLKGHSDDRLRAEILATVLENARMGGGRNYV